MAETYFCSPGPIKSGTYRPADSSSEAGISISFPDLQPFWYDDQTGIYLTYVDSLVGKTETARIRKFVMGGVELAPLDAEVWLTVEAGQCRHQPMGVIPPAVLQ